MKLYTKVEIIIKKLYYLIEEKLCSEKKKTKKIGEINRFSYVNFFVFSEHHFSDFRRFEKKNLIINE